MSASPAAALDARAVPEVVEAEGVRWSVERAWPGADPGEPIAIEARSRLGVRAGTWSAGAGAALVREDDRLPALAQLRGRGTVLGHRLGRRAVLRLDDGRYAKAVRRGRAPALEAAHRLGAALPVPTPAVAHVEPALLVLAGLPGRTLESLGDDPAGDERTWQRAWAAWAACWPGVATAFGAAADAEHQLGAHGVDEEAAVLRDWARRAGTAEGPAMVARMAALAEAAARGLEPDRDRARLLAHRDLHGAQLLWDASAGLALLDLDTLALADPALDLGNLLAHVDLAVSQRRWAPRRAAAPVAAVARVAEVLGIAPARVERWRLAAAVRVALVHRVRPRGRAWAGRELVRLERRLADDGLLGRR